MTNDIPEPLYITQKLTLTVKRILMQSTVLEDTWVDGVIHHPSLSEGVRSTSPPPSSQPPPPPPVMQIGQINAYQVRVLK